MCNLFPNEWSVPIYHCYVFYITYLNSETYEVKYFYNNFHLKSKYIKISFSVSVNILLLSICYLELVRQRKFQVIVTISSLYSFSPNI